MNHITNIIDTLNPKGGKGVGETIIAVTLIIAIVFLSYNNADLPKELLVGLGVVLGYIFGDNKKSEKESGD